LRAVCLAAMVAVVLGAPAAHADPLSLEDAFKLAESGSPALTAARLEVPVAQAGVGVARQIPNPELAFEETRETPRDALSFTFPLETGGKRGRRVDVAGAAVATSQATLARAGIELRAKVRRAFYGLCAADRSAKEAAALAELAARSRTAVQERFDAGDAPKLELLQVQLAATQTESEADAARALVGSRRAELNVLLGRAPEAATTVNGDLGDGTVPDLSDVSARALRESGDVVVLERQVEEQTQRVKLVQAERWPDLGLMAGVTHRDPDFDWGWRAGISLTLPLFHNHGAEIQVQEATLTQLTAERSAREAAIRGEVRAAWELADARGRQYASYRDRILPAAAEVESMAEESYRSGETGLMAMVQSITAVRDARSRAIEAGLAFQEALADLEQATGAPLP